MAEDLGRQSRHSTLRFVAARCDVAVDGPFLIGRRHRRSRLPTESISNRAPSPSVS